MKLQKELRARGVSEEDVSLRICINKYIHYFLFAFIYQEIEILILWRWGDSYLSRQ